MDRAQGGIRGRRRRRGGWGKGVKGVKGKAAAGLHPIGA
jgi:hypothetical protein